MTLDFSNNIFSLMVKKNLTRKEIGNSIYKKLGFSKNFSVTLVDDFFNFLTNDIVKINRVKISTFGTFFVQNKKERIGRNPKTKEDAIISSRKVIKFKPSKSFRDKLNKI